MPFTVDIRANDVLAWTATPTGARAERVTDHTPTIAVEAADGPLAEIESFLAGHPSVVATRIEDWRPGFRADPEPVVRADLAHVDDVRRVAWAVRDRGPPGAFRCHDVDLSREFRYCLETGASPVPAGPLTSLELSVGPLALREAPLGEVTVGSGQVLRTAGLAADVSRTAAGLPDPPAHAGGADEADAADAAAAAEAALPEVESTTVTGTPAEVVDAVQARVDAVDPDVLVVNESAVVPRLFETAAAAERELRLGREPDCGAGAGGASTADAAAWETGHGYQQLAGESTYESYGRVGHSPARYNLTGRAIVDRSNTFVYHEANLHGVLDLVARSGKPLQELSWASIGTILTAIQICEARSRGVLAPWRSWRHEFFKPMATLHDADRGGYTFAPDVGLHADVHELDFSSLYPNIIRTRNVSPERVRCDCCDTADVPGLGYSICEEDGYLPEVLAPLIDDRAGFKEELTTLEARAGTAREQPGDATRRAALSGKADAIKWILVSCFGYQGFSNAKFGRIECHEAINAFAREILLDAKEALEAGGWRVIHGIVDSLWVTRAADRREAAERASGRSQRDRHASRAADRREAAERASGRSQRDRHASRAADARALEDLAEEISDDAGIALEYEGHFDWLALCPQRQSDAGALTKYFGARAEVPHRERVGTDDADDPDRDAYKYRGIECRQRSTTAFVGRVQEDLVRTLDRALGDDPAAFAGDGGGGGGGPGGGGGSGDAIATVHRQAAIEGGSPVDEAARAVCATLRDHLADLEAGRVDPAELAVRNRTSKTVDDYSQYTRTVAALERAGDRDLDVAAGRDVEYVVVDDEKDSRDRVALAVEEPDTYDPSFYRERLLRVAESVLAPLGWRQADVEAYLADHRDASLAAFGD